jgi:cellulose synthase (UDP-forming)
VPGESELFYGVIQPGIDTWNASFFCGSCAVLRRSALTDVGGIAVETVTEDAHTALKMHRRGWRTAYLDVPQAAGLSTETLAAHVGQRIRWARGMAQIFRLDNPLLGRGLKLTQRLSYLAAMLHFFSGIPRLVFLIAPVAYLVFGRHIFNALPLLAVAYGLPHLIHSTACNARIHGRFRHSFWSEVYETCLAWYTAVPTTLALIAPRLGKFNVTSKGGRVDVPYFDGRIALPYLLLGIVNVAAICAGALKLSGGGGEIDSLAINMAWALHNLIVVAATIGAACERPQVRSAQRVPARLPAMLRLADGSTAAAETRELGRDGLSLMLRSRPPVSRREDVCVSLFSFDAEHPLPAEVLDVRDRTVRVRFGPLTLEQERHLVRAIFSRADAWLDWTEGHRRDRPLLTLASIARHGANGVLRALALSLRLRMLPPRVAQPVRGEA